MARAEWRVYYADGRVVSGRTPEEWRAAPDTGVQVVALFEIPPPDNRPWTNVADRFLWTGDDVYDPFGWGEKHGALIGDAEYSRIWQRAAYGDV